MRIWIPPNSAILDDDFSDHRAVCDGVLAAADLLLHLLLEEEQAPRQEPQLQILTNVSQLINTILQNLPLIWALSLFSRYSAENE